MYHYLKFHVNGRKNIYANKIFMNTNNHICDTIILLPVGIVDPDICFVCVLWNMPVFLTANDAISANFPITPSPILNKQ